MAGSRSFGNERPKKRHLVQKEKGGVAGEVGDLRRDVEQGVGSLEEELDELITVLDNNTVLISGKIKLNFQGVGVAIGIDGADPRKVNIVVNPGSVASAKLSAHSIDTADVAQGRAVFVSANNKILHADARYYEKSIVAGLYEGDSGSFVAGGVVASAKFSDASPIPVPGNRVFLAKADDELLEAAAGKLTVACPATGFVAEVGEVTYVNAVTFLATRTASVFVRVQKIMKRSS